MAKRFSTIKSQTEITQTKTDPQAPPPFQGVGQTGLRQDEPWSPVDSYRELCLRLARRNLNRASHQLILEPMRALRFLREQADRGRCSAEPTDFFCLGVFGLIEVRGGKTLLTNAAKRLLEETKSWPHMLLIRGSSSPLRERWLDRVPF